MRSALKEFSKFNPLSASGKEPYRLANFINGEWTNSNNSTRAVVDPLNGEPFIEMPGLHDRDYAKVCQAIKATPKSGLHNPIKNIERYVKYGEISRKAAEMLSDPAIKEHFARCIVRVAPKSMTQALGEVEIVRLFLANFSGDQVRFLARGFHVSGDLDSQVTMGYRFPYGPVALVTPFNFPLEIPVLQLMGALFMGNHVTLKAATTVSIVMEEWIRLLLACGMPPTDLNFVQCDGGTFEKIMTETNDSLRLTQFTGSSRVAEDLARLTAGKIRIEDAGFNWKIYGPEQVDETTLQRVAYTTDQDCFAHSGQKCSAQSIGFVHSNWKIFDKLKDLASKRNLNQDLTIGPVLTHTTENILEHAGALLKIPGAKLLFGGKPLQEPHAIPKKYGAVEPTAVFVPLKEIRANFDLVTKEIFGPFTVFTTWDSEDDLQEILGLTESMSHHLTAAVVSSDSSFQNRVLGSTVNGTTYTGIRARTTGAPQNHFFGPGCDPRGAGIGSIEAIRNVWSYHREIVVDNHKVGGEWKQPATS